MPHLSLLLFVVIVLFPGNNSERVVGSDADFSVIAEPKLERPTQPENPKALEVAPPPRPITVIVQRIKDGTGVRADEMAIAYGLRWLAQEQKSDGSWEFDGSDKKEATAATGLALLAFLGIGETNIQSNKYLKTVQAGMNWLLKDLPIKGANAGKFTSAITPYGQAIATLALCEAYNMTKDKKLLVPAQAAIDYIQRTQEANGSWGETPGNTDTSLVGWQVQALQVARLSRDIKVDDMVVKKVITFLNSTGGGSRKAKYGQKNATGAAPDTGLTAAGLLCRYYFDKWGPDSAGMAEGVLGLMKRAPNTNAMQQPAFDMYFYYHATHVVHFFEGDELKTWNEGPEKPNGDRTGGLRDWLSNLQIRQKDKAQGYWDGDAGFIGKNWGGVGTTAMCLLTLEVRFKYLSFDKRGEKGSSAKDILDEYLKKNNDPKKP